MKKNTFRSVATFACLTAIAGASCKKIIHSNEPTPNNVRLLGYNRVTTVNTSVPVPAPAVYYNESFRFHYDNSGRVSQIVYTGNKTGALQQLIDFSYRSDTVFRSVTDVMAGMVVERDTFVKNSLGQIVAAYMAGIGRSGVKYTFEYYGKLLARVNKEATNWHTISMNTSATYTSVNGDLLKQTTDGRLNVAFSNVTSPVNIDWLQSFDSHGAITGHSASTHVFNTYDYTRGMYVFVRDAAGDTSSLTYPAWNWSNESYQFYTNDANRAGDYLQMESIVMFGQNIYQNNHLVESIAAPDKNAYITYRIDADSKIVQATVAMTDKLLNKTTCTYDMQYEQY